MRDYNNDLFDEYSANMLESLCNTPKEQIKLGALTQIVKKYDIYEVLTSISALNLFPDNQNKSDLFDAAIMALLSKPYSAYRRARLPDNNLLQQITRQLSRLEARMRVDPRQMPIKQVKRTTRHLPYTLFKCQTDQHKAMVWHFSYVMTYSWLTVIYRFRVCFWSIYGIEMTSKLSSKKYHSNVALRILYFHR